MLLSLLRLDDQQLHVVCDIATDVAKVVALLSLPRIDRSLAEGAGQMW